MIKLSEEARRLTSTFFAYRNDIDIYTEDEEKDKEFYKTLFKRLLKEGIIINDVTPLGSKKAVKNRCENEPDNGRKKLFIIDGDITIIHGKGIPSLKNLFVLDGYCIENFLFNKKTLVQFIYLNCAVKAIETIEQEIDFENWLDSYKDALIELFLHFAIADFYGKKFTLYNANKYHERIKDKYIFNKSLVLQDIEKIRIEVENDIGTDLYSQKYDELRQKWDSSINNLFTIVSGKDYLVPILLIKTQYFKSSRALPSLEEVKMQLAQFSDLTRLQKLKQVIEELV